MASTLGSTSRHAEHFTKPSVAVGSLEEFQKILDSEELDLGEFADDMAYLGFDKTKIAKLAAKNLGARMVVMLCLLGGMRGTNLGKILSKSVKPDEDVVKLHKEGKILSNGNGPNDLTMGRLMAVFPEVVGHYMAKQSVPKKLSANSCPAALQFPAASGLPMSNDVRIAHLEFSVQFSFLISKDKKFHPQYYRAAFNGQLESARLSSVLKPICGNPVTSSSKAFDLDSAFNLMVEKYGADRFVVEKVFS